MPRGKGPALNPEKEQFIRENFQTMKQYELADKLGISTAVIYKFLLENNLKKVDTSHRRKFDGRKEGYFHESQIREAFIGL